MDVCRDCGGKLCIGRFETYCTNCGTVWEDSPINFGNEAFCDDPDKMEKKRRTGAPISWLNPDFSTTFNPKEWRKVLVSRRR